MCRLIVYKGRGRRYAVTLSDLVVRPSHSIIKQSFGCRERLTAGAVPPHLNGDGFGIGWFCDEEDVDDSYDFAQRVPDSVGKQGETKSPVHISHGDKSDLVINKSICTNKSTLLKNADHASQKVQGLRRHETPGVYTSITPAWNNPNLVRLSEKIRSSCVFAHVRAASLGSPVTELNCHPFAFGRYLWMHNGFLAGFDRLRRRMISFMSDSAFQSIQGTSDSEHCFGVFLTNLENSLAPAVIDQKVSADVLKNCMLQTIRQLEQWSLEAGILPLEPSLLNFALSDGDTVIATRHVLGKGIAATLYFSSGTRWHEDPSMPGEYHMLHADRREHVVIVASERLTASPEDWMPVPPNHLVLISPTINVQLIPIPSETSDTLAPHGKCIPLKPETVSVPLTCRVRRNVATSQPKEKNSIARSQTDDSHTAQIPNYLKDPSSSIAFIDPPMEWHVNKSSYNP